MSSPEMTLDVLVPYAPLITIAVTIVVTIAGFTAWMIRVRIEALHEQQKTLEVDIKSKDSRISYLDKEIKELRGYNAIIISQRDEAMKDVQNAMDKARELISQAPNAVKNHVENISYLLQDQIKEYKDNIAKLRKEIKNKDKEIAILRNKLDRIKDNWSNERGRVITLEAERNAFKEQIVVINDRIKELNTKFTKVSNIKRSFDYGLFDTDILTETRRRLDDILNKIHAKAIFRARQASSIGREAAKNREFREIMEKKRIQEEKDKIYIRKQI